MLHSDLKQPTALPARRLKFSDPLITARGEPRATVTLGELKTLWFNTGTLCNITCRNCYIESSPKNDRLAYLTLREVQMFLDEIKQDGWNTREIGFTGGEPFMNPEIFGMLDSCLALGFEVLVLTNAMRPLHQKRRQLLDLKPCFKDALTIRVSLDHYSANRHDEVRGAGSFRSTLEGLIWLAHNGFRIAVAGRTMWGEDQAALRAGYAKLFAKHGIGIDIGHPVQMVFFPEMDSSADVPEITTACWDILGKSPSAVMCSHSRMIIKRKGSDRLAVVSCTLLPYDAQFELGHTLREAKRCVPLNHPHCAKFCVLGGASCSAR